LEEGEKVNSELITPDVIEDCLCESFDITESHKQNSEIELAS
jgi:hypothetical protein